MNVVNPTESCSYCVVLSILITDRYHYHIYVTNTELCFSYHQNGLNGVRTSAALDSKLPTTDYLFNAY